MSTILRKAHHFLYAAIATLLASQSLCADTQLLVGAIMNGTPEEINRLIDNGEDVNLEFPNDTSIISTPLLLAVYNGRLEAASVLLERGAKVNYISRSGNTALRQAIRFTQGDQVLGFVKLLLKYGADPDIKNEDHRSARDAVNTPVYENIAALMQQAKPIHGWH